MKSLTVAAFLFVPLCFSAPEPAKRTPSEDSTTAARSRVLELAGAFANDGYKLRDGYWTSVLEPGKPLFIEVNLFAGNEYWFSAAALVPARKIAVSIFDAKGRPLEGKIYEDGPTAAVGLEPQISGRFFVRVEMLEGDKSNFCLVYSYK